MHIKIEWKHDEHRCETCGFNFASGALVYFNDTCVLDLVPIASCFDGQDYPPEDVFAEILDKLGHTLEERCVENDYETHDD